MIFENEIEKFDTEEIINSSYINWDFFKNTSVLVTGATGLIGKQTVKTLLLANELFNSNIRIYALVRNTEKTKKVFKDICTKNLNFVIQDITSPIKTEKNVDFIIHTANSTASKDFVEKPVETIDTIITGTKNILEYAKKTNSKSIVYLSSMEVYGDISLDRKEQLKEDDLGYINISKTRNSYPLGKRLAENMCFSYFSEYNIPVKTARLSQTIGANVGYNDNRVFAQFARNIVEKQDIILHTKGKTIRSYCYITDAVIAILLMLEKGKNGEIYNIANSNSTCSIKEMAEMLCQKYPNSKLKIEIDERLYPNDTKYHLDTTKYYSHTGWQAKISLEEMFSRLITNFRNHI